MTVTRISTELGLTGQGNGASQNRHRIDICRQPGVCATQSPRLRARCSSCRPRTGGFGGTFPTPDDSDGVLIIGSCRVVLQTPQLTQSRILSISLNGSTGSVAARTLQSRLRRSDSQRTHAHVRGVPDSSPRIEFWYSTIGCMRAMLLVYSIITHSASVSCLGVTVWVGNRWPLGFVSSSSFRLRSSTLRPGCIAYSAVTAWWVVTRGPPLTKKLYLYSRVVGPGRRTTHRSMLNSGDRLQTGSANGIVRVSSQYSPAGV